MFQAPLEMKVMLRFFGTVQVVEPVPRHLDRLEMPMILSRYLFSSQMPSYFALR